jgi:hypothetical protein
LLLSQCNDFIGRLHIYDLRKSGEHVVELQHIAAKIIRNLVRVLRFSVNTYRSKKERWVKLAKQSFLGDNELDNLFSELSSLVEDEHRLLAALTYKDVKNIQQVLTQQQYASDAKALRTTISKALGFADKPERVWMDKLQDIRNSLIPKMGDWVIETADFKNWVALPTDPAFTESNTKPFLLIEGPENAGKSYLMANIVNYLQRQRSHHAIAYYFHDQGANRQMNETRILSIVSKCLMWQCATSFEVLMKPISEKCQQIGYNPNIDDMWRQLFLQNSRIDTLKECFFVLLDGLQDEVKKIIKTLKELVDRHPQKFRILVTTRSSEVREMLLSDQHFCIDLAAQAQPNKEDIDIFIKHQLDEMDAFRNSEHQGAIPYKEKIAKRVRDAMRGDFALMTITLEKLRPKHYLTDIDLILDGMEKGREDQIRSEIERLNKYLSSEEIKELNEVILWTLTAEFTPTLSDMSAVLACGSFPESLMPLRRRLNPLLQANESSRIEFRLGEIKTQIPEHESSNRKSLMGTTGSVQLVEMEVKLVHDFLEYVSPKKNDYDKKALERLLWSDSLNCMKTTISYDKKNAHLKIALTYLQVFTKTYDEHTERLLPYARTYLLHHLSEAKPLEVDKNLKADLGKSLVKLFKDVLCIDKMFWTRMEPMSHTTWLQTEGVWLRENRERWLYTDKGVEVVLKWFSDTATRSDVLDTDKDWIDELIDEKNKGRHHEILLQDVAERLATHLFLEKSYTTREQYTAVYFLSGYVSRVEKENKDLKDDDSMNWAKFCRIKEWAKTSAKVGNESDKVSWCWKIQIARTIFAVCQNDQEATDEADKLLKEVQNLEGGPWKGSLLACETIAEHLWLNGLESEAQKILKEAMEIEPSNDTEMHESNSDVLLAAIIRLDLGDLYWKKEHPELESAKKVYQESLEFNTTRYARYIDVLRHYREAGKHSWIINFVKELTNKREFPKPYLQRLVYEFLTEDEFQNSLLSAAKENNWGEVVRETFEKAINAADGSRVELFHIMKTYGNILHRSRDREREDDIVKQWETAVEYGKPLVKTTGPIGWPDIYSVIEPLAYIYLERAKTALGKAKAAGKSNDMLTKIAKENTANKYLCSIEKLKQKTDIWMNISLTCCLARYHTIAGDCQSAKKAVSKAVAASIGILSDDDESNDWFAYLQLGRIMDALQDKTNCKKAWERLENLMPPKTDLSRWFLCDECKQGIHLHEGVYVCLEFFQLRFFHSGCYDNSNEEKSQATRVELRKDTFIKSNADDKNDIVPPEEKEKRKKSLECWKTELEKKYVSPKGTTSSSNSATLPAPAPKKEESKRRAETTTRRQRLGKKK